ncbi:MAG: type II toxin-antitoxin system PemK/MazF family toxin [Rudaea sp.]
MPIACHPSIGETLWCDYSGIEPEMVKRRLVVVVSPRTSQRYKLVTVVPISATEPSAILPWHVKLHRDPYPKGDKPDLWVKCDMINVVCFERLAGYHFRWNGARKYHRMAVSRDELRAIRAGMLAALGLTNDD